MTHNEKLKYIMNDTKELEDFLQKGEFFKMDDNLYCIESIDWTCNPKEIIAINVSTKRGRKIDSNEWIMNCQ